MGKNPLGVMATFLCDLKDGDDEGNCTGKGPENGSRLEERVSMGRE